jgi:hypothetical protein
MDFIGTASVTTSGVSVIEVSGIPQTYNTLYVIASIRDTTTTLRTRTYGILDSLGTSLGQNSTVRQIFDQENATEGNGVAGMLSLTNADSELDARTHAETYITGYSQTNLPYSIFSFGFAETIFGTGIISHSVGTDGARLGIDTVRLTLTEFSVGSYISVYAF